MSRAEKIKVDRVICDEIFYLSGTREEVEFELPEGTSLGSAPITDGTVTAGVLECDLEEDNGEITAVVEFMIQEELQVTPGGEGAEGGIVELEYGFRIIRNLTFQKCQIPDYLTLEDLRCQVFRFEVDVQLDNLQPDAIDPTRVTFDNLVRIMVKIKVVEEIQAFVATGTAPDVTTNLIVSS